MKSIFRILSALIVCIQAEARAYRIGQNKKVLVVMFISRGTVDMNILSALMEKKDVHEYVMEQPQTALFGEGK